MFGGQGWTAWVNTRVFNPFVIRDYKTFDKDPSKQIDQSFMSAKRWFDSQTHESMTRRSMQNKDFKNMIPIKAVAFFFTFLFGTNKAVCSLVK